MLLWLNPRQSLMNALKDASTPLISRMESKDGLLRRFSQMVAFSIGFA